jgi:hypothetical protein
MYTIHLTAPTEKGWQPISINVPDKAWAKWMSQAFKSYAYDVGFPAPKILSVVEDITEEPTSS